MTLPSVPRQPSLPFRFRVFCVFCGNSPPFRRRDAGFSIVELTVAIVITTMIAAFVLGMYVVVVKSFQRHVVRAEAAKTAMVTRIHVQAALNDVAVVHAWRKDGIDYCDANSDTLHTIKFEKRALFRDNVRIAQDLSSFAFDLHQGGNGKSLLLWNAGVARGPWLGGAVACAASEITGTQRAPAP